MIFPNVELRVLKNVGRDAFNQFTFTGYAVEKCSPVRLDFTTMTTTVRTDSGATQGHAREADHKVVILVRPNSIAARIDAVVELMGYRLVVRGIEPRFTVQGRLDHYQLSLAPWA